MKKWEVLGKHKIGPKFNTADLLKILLRNRGIKSEKEVKNFLNPNLKKISAKSVGIDEKEVKKSVARIKSAIKNKEQIIVFGDYDVDGICGSAILWETLNAAGAKVLPYIPNRIDEGYGLSIAGISNVKSQISDIKLIITVDNGIVANGAVQYANGQGIDVIITDHHVPSDKLPDAFSIVHTTNLCGAGVAWVLSQEFKTKLDHLELAALATVADLVSLTSANRAIVKFGIEKLRNTKRIGLLELYKFAGLDKNSIGTYEIGHIIAPRLNAMGRLESAMDSLRLICTANPKRAEELAFKLNNTNSQRRSVTEEAVAHALSSIKIGKINGKLIFVAHESYQQGVIGLVAGKLVEQYYLPSIVISKGELLSRASARSISGFNIIEFIRLASEYLVDAGGHPMAAGFTVETAKIELLQKRLEELALKQIAKKMLDQILKIDLEIPVSLVTNQTYDAVQKLSPFGMGNPMPIFASKVLIESLKTVGNGSRHIKFVFKDSDSIMEGIWFGAGDRINEFEIGDKIEIAYTIDQNVWNGNKRLQLKIRDIKP